MSWNDFERIADSLPSRDGESILVVREAGELVCRKPPAREADDEFGPIAMTAYMPAVAVGGFAVWLSIHLRHAWRRSAGAAALAGLTLVLVLAATLEFHLAAFVAVPALLTVTTLAALWVGDRAVRLTFEKHEPMLELLLQDELISAFEFCEIAGTQPTTVLAAEAVARWYPSESVELAETLHRPTSEPDDDDAWIYADPDDEDDEEFERSEEGDADEP